MISIKEINWLSKEALEAEVIITDGSFNLRCFGHPFRMKEGDQLKQPLLALDPNEVKRLEDQCSEAKRLDSAFGYLIKGRLIDKESGLVKLGDIIIDIDGKFIPGDLRNNDYISFKCDRLDI